MPVSGRIDPWLAPLAGALLSVPFWPKLPWLSALTPLCLLPLFWLAARAAHPDGSTSLRRTLAIGWLYAGAQVATVMIWIPSMVPDNLTYTWVMWPALVLMCAYLGFWPAVAFTVAVRIARGSRVPVGIALAAAWAIGEWIGAKGVMGFAWLGIGNALAGIPMLYQTLDLYGLFGLSFVTLLVTALLAARSQRSLSAASVITAAALTYGVIQLGAADASARAIHVGLIQPNLGAGEKWNPVNRNAVFTRYLHQSDELADAGVKLIVWPETALPFRLMHPGGAGYRAELEDWTTRTGIPIVTGMPHVDVVDEEDVFYNAATLIEPGVHGDHPIYRKRHLVPFSEWLPFRFLRLMEINFGQADFTPGTDPAPFEAAGERAGMMICIEAIYPDLARDLVRSGATFLVNITNDVWFGDTAGPYQHANLSRYRAVETRRPMVRCANTGISMCIDRAGRAIARLGTFEMNTLDCTIDATDRLTPYVRFGDWIVIPLGLILITTAAWRRGPGGRLG